MLKLFEKCPACGKSIVITELKCPHCNLVMQGEFTGGAFSALSEDQFTFIRAFLKVRGNLSELEKVLGISYPTIRNKLDEINTVLELAEAQPAATAPTGGNDRKAILQQVSEGRLSTAEALQRIKEIKGE
jgi:hypothetical protein